MRALIQRVEEAKVQIEAKTYASISQGLLLLLGIEDQDTNEDVYWLVKKISQLRIFSDEKGLMNISLMENKGMALIISQFTLFSQIKKGNRPSFIKASKPEIAIPLYNLFIKEMKQVIGSSNIKNGIFGADMKIHLINDGPVTIWIDTKNKE
jgi:D-aminoacyl-tRNA deacylase